MYIYIYIYVCIHIYVGRTPDDSHLREKFRVLEELGDIDLEADMQGHEEPDHDAALVLVA
jgi:hypothetical protein